MAHQYGQIDHHSPRHANNSYTAVVVRIGDEPLLNIRGVGNVRFAYRHVKKAPGEAKPVVHVGDRVTCRLMPCSPPKAVSVRIQASASPKQALSIPQQDTAPPFLFSTSRWTSASSLNTALESTASLLLPATGDSSSASISSNSLADLTEQSELTVVSYSHDPYSMSAVKLEYASISPSMSVRSVGDTSQMFSSPAASPRHAAPVH